MVRRLGQARLTELRAAFNAFSRTVAVQSIAVTDSAVRQRVRRHVELIARVVTRAESSPASGVALILTARRHADAVIEAFDTPLQRRCAALVTAAFPG
jgi:hypothetical protein